MSRRILIILAATFFSIVVSTGWTLRGAAAPARQAQVKAAVPAPKAPAPVIAFAARKLRPAVEPQMLTFAGGPVSTRTTATVSRPDGVLMNFGPGALTVLDPKTFRLPLTLDVAGTYELRVRNPDGQASNTVKFDVK